LVGVGEQRAQRRLGSSYGRGLLSPSEFGDEVRADVARVNGRERAGEQRPRKCSEIVVVGVDRMRVAVLARRLEQLDEISQRERALWSQRRGAAICTMACVPTFGTVG
jgi:hypothetical protein